ncbi:DUF4367 domain-containing protein [Bacillus subtilis]|uniref:DUF4367 domain-containing protein n=1 Tax=Bacillus subtilis TaxID=1423 RepID=A0AAX3RPK8_BACIU|nr:MULTISPECIES: DUF4367 domain-containing protein [Bacillus amyloliquefaciens group]MED3604247.1 DUF4367 domain-containing protein [Bacillus subtilis]MED3696179.1 DUF4367 domain-containing protein [Bacillus subtilis]NRF33595.1 DUF4367 domain-containing protein [Bacillus velezensis]OCB95961.1 hypothetical protein SRCM101294_01782 [Bacillus amyloliquefaciens]QQD82058.1 DUF4367 domain-containing protein [Bacillus siamensis]
MKYPLRFMIGISLSLVFLLNPWSNLKVTATSDLGVGNSSRKDLSYLKEHANFHVLVPKDTSSNWKLTIKNYPNQDKKISMTRLNYEDHAYRNYVMVGIAQSKFKNQPLRYSDGKNVKNVTINGQKGIFERWADGTKGGILRWVQNGTYVEMDSSNLKDTEMVQLAQSMK